MKKGCPKGDKHAKDTKRVTMDLGSACHNTDSTKDKRDA